MLGMPSPNLSSWIQSQTSKCSILVFHSCLKFSDQNICPFFPDKLPFLLMFQISISLSSFPLGSSILVFEIPFYPSFPYILSLNYVISFFAKLEFSPVIFPLASPTFMSYSLQASCLLQTDLWDFRC